MFYPEADNVALELRLQLYDVLRLDDLRRGGDGRSWVFIGQLLQDAESAFHVLEERFRALGYLPLLRRESQHDLIVAVPTSLDGGPVRRLLALILFIGTVGTTLAAGATQLLGYRFTPLKDPLQLLYGVPYAFTLLAVLGTHELGHYFAARRQGMRASLPYFIPVPFGLGTFGAFIQMRSPIRDRKALFDVGLAGPVAGLVVALPLLIVGLALSTPVWGLPAPTRSLGFQFLVGLLHGLPGQRWAIELHPIAFAATFAIWITALNFLPIGQLDGGHVAYAMLGPAARAVGWLTLATMLFMGRMWMGWYVWVLLILFMGFSHPPTLNEITPLDSGRRLAGVLTAGLMFLFFSPVPMGFLA